MDFDWREAWKLAEAADQKEAEQSQPKVEDHCPECKHPIENNADKFKSFCPNCGVITDSYADERPEWNGRNTDYKPFARDMARGEAINPLMPHASLTTDIVPQRGMRYDQYKMIKLNRWGTLSPMERSLCAVFKKIEHACNRANIPSNYQYTTKTLFRKVYERNMEKQKKGRKREGLRGPKRDGLIGACLYMSFKIHQNYWTKDRVAAVFDITPQELRRGISIFWKLVKDIRESLTNQLDTITGVRQYVRWFSIELSLPPKIASLAIDLYRELKHYGVGASKQPQSVAAGCIMAVCETYPASAIEVEDIVNTTGISKATIRDVRSIMNPLDRHALVLIYCHEILELNWFSNPLTTTKIEATATRMLWIPALEHQGLWEIATFAVYFVLVAQNIAFDANHFYQTTSSSLREMLRMTRSVIRWKDDLLEKTGCNIIRESCQDDYVDEDDSW